MFRLTTQGKRGLAEEEEASKYRHIWFPPRSFLILRDIRDNGFPESSDWELITLLIEMGYIELIE